MITQKLARAIFNCHAEIQNTEKLLEKIDSDEKRFEVEERDVFNHNDLEERYASYQLGVPTDNSGNSRMIYHLNPSMAKAVLIAHKAKQKARLTELNQFAKLELETEEGDDSQQA